MMKSSNECDGIIYTVAVHDAVCVVVLIQLLLRKSYKFCRKQIEVVRYNPHEQFGLLSVWTLLVFSTH